MVTQWAVYEARLWLASNLSWRLAPSHIRPTDAGIKLTENRQARCTTCDYWKHRSRDDIHTAAAMGLIRRLGSSWNAAVNPPCMLAYATVYVASDGSVRPGCYVFPPVGTFGRRTSVTFSNLTSMAGEPRRC
jgi:hypothetical protein